MTVVVLRCRCPVVAEWERQVPLAEVTVAPSTFGGGIAIHWPCDLCDEIHQKLLTVGLFDWLAEQKFPFFTALGGDLR